MDFDQLDIQSLVNRFWEGRTSLEEEEQMRQYFAYREVPEELQAVADYFALVEEDLPVPGDDFDARILAMTTGKPKRTLMRSLTPWIRVAAVLVLALGVWFGIQRSDPGVQVAEEPSQEQIRDAFEQTRNALMFMSGKMKEGTSHTQKLDKMKTVIRSNADESVEGKGK